MTLLPSNRPLLLRLSRRADRTIPAIFVELRPARRADRIAPAVFVAVPAAIATGESGLSVRVFVETKARRRVIAVGADHSDPLDGEDCFSIGSHLRGPSRPGPCRRARSRTSTK